MLTRVLSRRRLHAVSVAEPLPLAGDAERLRRLSNQALRTLAQLEEARSPLDMFKAGDPNVFAVLWVAAEVSFNSENQPEDGEYSRFCEAAKRALFGVAQDLVNTSVIDALLLTIVLPLIFSDKVGPFEVGSAEAGLQHVAWADAASFFAGSGDSGSAAALRRRFYVAETVLLFISASMAFSGLFFSMSLLRNLNVLGERVLPRCELVVASSRLFSALGFFWGLGMVALMLALPFVAARYSAVAFFCSFAVIACQVLLQVMFIRTRPVDIVSREAAAVRRGALKTSDD